MSENRMAGDGPAIEARGLVKVYGRHRALDGIDLTVQRGQVFGFLGPNGAGKTTTIRILATLTRPDGGTARVLGLDVRSEPTTGMDPRSQIQVWELVRRIAAAGTTVLLTTQYLEEADQLAEQIAVIDHGQIVAEGTSAQLKAQVGSGALHIRLLDAGQRSRAQAVLAETLEAPVQLGADPLDLSVLLGTPADPADPTDPGRLAGHAMTQLAAAGMPVAEVTLGQPSLQEAFLALTGHPASPAATDREDAIS